MGEEKPKRRSGVYQLVAAALVVVITLAAILLPRKGKEGGTVEVPKTVTVTLTGEGRGPLALIDAGHPLGKTDALSAGASAVPALWYTADGMEVTDPSLRVDPLLLLGLDRMLTDYAKGNASYSVPVVSGAYLPPGDGQDPRCAALTVVLSLSVPSGDEMTTVPLSSPLAQPFCAWLNSHAALYGFTVTDTGTLRFVGTPHAAYLFSQSVTLSSYLTLLKEKTQKNPLVVETEGVTYEIFHVTAGEGGEAKVTLPAGVGYTVSGTNAGGYIVTLRRP